MVNSIFLTLLFFLSALVMPHEAKAQFSPGKKTESGAVMEYRKVSGDSVRMRKSVAAKKGVNEKGRATGQDGSSKTKKQVKPAAKKAAVKKEPQVDSLRYEPVRYSLGDRIIMPGDCGHDVRSVANILVKKLYMDENYIIYTDDGAVKYEGELVRAMKFFQEFNGFYPDGIIGQKEVKALRKRK